MNEPDGRRDTARPVTFAYLFSLYFILGGAETMISPLFPLVRRDLDLTESHQAAILAVVAAGIASFSVIGGVASRRLNDRQRVRVTTACLTLGMVLSAAANSFWVLLAGQALLGVAFGFFFPAALASVARLYAGAQGKAIAIWGQAYSFGLTAAALSGFAGGGWRWVFAGCAGAALASVLYLPRWTQPPRDPAPAGLLVQLERYVRTRAYRLAGYASFGGASMHFVVIGFAPVFFVDRGIDLRLVAVLLAGGRALSAAVKLGAGAMYDRNGGPWTARLLLLATTALGVPLLLLPAGIGVGFLVPFVGIAVSVLPVANAMVVAALPEQSGWGIGTFRAGLLGASALLSAIVSLLLGTGVQLHVLMVVTLGLPAVVALAMHRSVSGTGYSTITG